ncbi:ParE family toxin-like protein [Candidatus Magnetobacterium casense]|uniref:ParE family toxin-like protein n=1 Tax=Candidatus Magnetobacterium casense TaxID=1455061 RepID=UPI003EB82BB1
MQRKFDKQIRLLSKNPRHPSLKIHKIQGSDYWEFYVDRSYRCVFRQEGNIYRLCAVGNHDIIG